MYVTLEEAAFRLAMTRGGLRKRLSRGAVRRGRDTVCELGDGVVAVKFKNRWRVRFPERADG